VTIYKVGWKASDMAADIEYIDAEDEENAAMIYDKIYCSTGIHKEYTGYHTEFFVKKLGLFRITTHVVRISILPSGVEYKKLKKSWKPLTWFA
jgi:hypothetical protein